MHYICKGRSSVEMLRMIFATASCVSPKCSIAMKNRNHGATLINEWNMLHTDTRQTWHNIHLSNRQQCKP